jgi:hypothetical protein
MDDRLRAMSLSFDWEVDDILKRSHANHPIITWQAKFEFIKSVPSAQEHRKQLLYKTMGFSIL